MSSSKRKPNWSGAEIEAFAQAVSENIRTVKGKFTPALTQETKNKCWIAITERYVFYGFPQCLYIAELCKLPSDFSDFSVRLYIFIHDILKRF